MWKDVLACLERIQEHNANLPKGLSAKLRVFSAWSSMDEAAKKATGVTSDQIKAAGFKDDLKAMSS